MTRLLPDSLFGRIVLVLLTGLVLAQLGSALISARESQRLLRMSDERQWSERLSGAVRLMDALPPQSRLKARGALETRRLALQIAPFRADGAGQPAAEAQQSLARLLGPEFTVAARRLPDHDVVQYQVQLRDGQWLFMNYRPRSELSLPQELLWRLLLLSGTALFLTLVATRAALQPLRRFTRAAERLGGDLESPALPVTGARETREAARVLNRMQVQIRESIGERTRLLAAISHDLRTPLTRLRLHAEFMSEDSELRDVLLKEVEIIQAMSRSAVDYLRGGQGEPIRNIDINALAEGIAADFTQLGLRITVIGHAYAPYPGRSLALRRALCNLVENASDYGGEEVRITIIDGNRGDLCISVEDNGPGIPEKEQSRMLEPFQRLEPSRSTDTGGHGLGLSIARSIARTHGGEFTIRNCANGGLQATLTLPRGRTPK